MFPGKGGLGTRQPGGWVMLGKGPGQLLPHRLNCRQSGAGGGQSFTWRFSSAAHRLPSGLPSPGAGGLLGVAPSLPSQTAKLPFGVTHLAFPGCEGTARPLYPPQTAPVPQ